DLEDEPRRRLHRVQTASVLTRPAPVQAEALPILSAMPTYEYACQSCGNQIEVYQRFNDEPLTVCPVCGGPLRKVFHPAGILFKGSGFYATDSRTARDGAKKE